LFWQALRRFAKAILSPPFALIPALLPMRELRLKIKQKGEAREPVDGELIRYGCVRGPDGREEEPRVTLDWGTGEEIGQQWLRVTDNGVGMTEDVIKTKLI
jgi:hypothetical protein